MEIIDFFESPQKESWIVKIDSCDWSAAKLLAKLLRNAQEFSEVLGGGKLYILKDGDKLVSFATLTKRECIKADDLYPWVGFVFTAPEYRGNKYSKTVIDHICNIAKSNGYEKVYIATEHATDVYKKYGFIYKDVMLDVFGVENDVLYKDV